MPIEYSFTLRRSDSSVSWGLMFKGRGSIENILPNSPAANAGIVLPAQISRVGTLTFRSSREIVEAIRLVDGCELHLCIVSDAVQLGGVSLGPVEEPEPTSSMGSSPGGRAVEAQALPPPSSAAALRHQRSLPIHNQQLDSPVQIPFPPAQIVVGQEVPANFEDDERKSRAHVWRPATITVLVCACINVLITVGAFATQTVLYTTFDPMPLAFNREVITVEISYWAAVITTVTGQAITRASFSLDQVSCQPALMLKLAATAHFIILFLLILVIVLCCFELIGKWLRGREKLSPIMIISTTVILLTLLHDLFLGIIRGNSLFQDCMHGHTVSTQLFTGTFYFIGPCWYMLMIVTFIESVGWVTYVSARYCEYCCRIPPKRRRVASPAGFQPVYVVNDEI